MTARMRQAPTIPARGQVAKKVAVLHDSPLRARRWGTTAPQLHKFALSSFQWLELGQNLLAVL